MGHHTIVLTKTTSILHHDFKKYMNLSKDS